MDPGGHTTGMRMFWIRFVQEKSLRTSNRHEEVLDRNRNNTNARLVCNDCCWAGLGDSMGT
eukprot:1159891-Pelagomonas_calceolata.AAC.4